jgi:hypothetical protein
MDKVTISLPRNQVNKLREAGLNDARQHLKSLVNSYGTQRDGSNDQEIAAACREFLAVYDNIKLPYETDQRGL